MPGAPLTRVRTGIPGLDNIMDGGFIENTITVVSGPAGSGKSLLAMQYLYNGAKNFNEPGIYITLEEGSASVKATMNAHGMDMDMLIASGKIFLIDLGEPETDGRSSSKVNGFRSITDLLTNLIKLSKAKRIVIDSVSAVGAFYTSVEEFRRSLITFVRFLKANNITAVIITEATRETFTRFEVEEYIADTFIIMGLKEVEGKLSRSLLVRKMRHTWHDTSSHPFTITTRGIEIIK
jgi:KaiC/GvpD/RAD55 family RecA-like ATPase